MRVIGLARRALSGQIGAQVVKQDRGLTDGEHAGLGARVVGHVGAIPHRIETRIGFGAQIGQHPNKPVFKRQSGVRQPILRPRARRTKGKVQIDTALGQLHPARIDRRDPRVGAHIDAQGLHPRHERPPRTRTNPRQGRLARLKQGHARIPPHGTQTMRAGHGKLTPRDARTDDADAGRIPAAVQKRGPPVGKGAKGFGRNRVLCEPRQGGQVRGDPDINRRDVVKHRRVPRDRNPARNAIYPRGAPDDHPRPRRAGQPHKVDIQIAPRIMARDHTGQHPRIGRGRAGIDHRDPHPRHRGHRPFAQNQSMGMPAPDQDQVTRQRVGGCLHHAPLAVALD